MRSTRAFAAIAVLPLIAAACSGSGGDTSASDTAPATSSVTTPAATAADATADTAPAGTAAATPADIGDAVDEPTPTDATPEPAPAPAQAAPEALQFTAPLVGGGELDATTLADKPTVFWFWAPN